MKKLSFFLISLFVFSALNAQVLKMAKPTGDYLSSNNSAKSYEIVEYPAPPPVSLKSATLSVEKSGLSDLSLTKNISAGGLYSALSTEELATATKLILSGNIDARDFKTMRDNMPLLAEIDLSGVTIVAYSGTEGTSIWNNTSYAANAIPESAFMNSNLQGKASLTSITLPSTVTSIENHSFAYCTSLFSVILSSGLEIIRSYAFNHCAFTSITIPASVTLIENSAFVGSAGDKNVNENNPNYSSLDGVLYNKAKTLLIHCPTSKYGAFTIPGTVTSTDFNSFWDCSGLTNVYIPSSVTTIGIQSFWGCSGLTSIDIPSSVTFIGGFTFTDCTGLSTFNFPPLINSIGDYTFQNCSGLKSITIPNTITSIGRSAFTGCTGLNAIHANSVVPINLSNSPNVFNRVDKTTCTLNVPYCTKSLYASANQWNDFTKVVESATGFSLGATTASVGSAANSMTTVVLNANVSWSASSDQSWLSVSPESGTSASASTSTLTIKATTANTSIGTRSAKVTVSSSGYSSQTVLVTQDGNNAPLNIIAGVLSTTLTASELASVAKLTLTGTIDARDFRTMRDLMPLLAEVDLSGATIVAYTGTEGTYYGANNTYTANGVPSYAFCNSNTGQGKISLTSVKLPTTTIIINNDAFEDCTNLSSVSIPSSVLTLGSNAFYNCDGLTSITVPASLTSIGSWAFGDCDKLTSFTIPGSVTSIGNNTFTDCDLLTSLVIDNANTNYSFVDGVLFNNANTELVACLTTKSGSLSIPATVSTIKLQAFWNCGGLTTILIPTSVKIIENGVFTGCWGLTTLDLPSSISSIGRNAFQNCSNLTSIKANWQVPLDLSSSSGVFNNLNKTNCTLNVPYGTKALYASANQWKDFTNIVESANGFSLGATTASVGSTANSSTTVALKANVSWSASSDQSWLSVSPASGTSNSTLTIKATTANPSIGTRSATVTVSSSGYSSQTVLVSQEGGALTLTAGTLSTTLTATQLATTTYLRLTGTIDARDFRTMRDLMPLLAEVDLSGTTIVAYTGTEGTYYGANNTYTANGVPSYAFCNSNTGQGKISLTSVKLPTTTTVINNDAFENCTNLSSVTIPSAVLTLGSYAFANCDGLTSIQLPSSLTSIGYYAFGNCDKLSVLTIPSSVSSIDRSFRYCSVLTTLIVDANNAYYSSADGVLFNKTKTELVACLTAKTGSYTIPATVASIKDGSFWDCNGLTSIIIPMSVRTIGNGSFTGCRGLTTLDLPSSITAIGSSAFQNCNKLTSITAKWQVPLDLSSSSGVFNNLNKTNCTLNVPYGTKALYASANQWKDFTNIVESANGFSLGAATASVGAAANSATTVTLKSNVSWSASSDQSWLSVSPASGTSNSTLTIKATTANTSIGTRSAKVTVSSSGYSSQTVLVTQDGNNGPLNITAGTLSTTLTASELASVVKLTLTGIIDARDFRTMRDLMPLLAEVDLSGTTIVAYTGTEGTYYGNNSTYQGNQVPIYAFRDPNTYPGGKTSLITIKLPTTTTMINNNAFGNCTNLSSVSIPLSVLSLGSYAFYNCDGLTSITVPASLTSIGSWTFGDCDKLTSFTIPGSVTLIGSNAFTYCDLLTSLVVDNANTNYSFADGVLFNKAKTELVACLTTKSGSYSIPATVLTIKFQAFWGCGGLTTILIPTSVKTIENRVFTGCQGLTTLDLPSSITAIGSYAFQDCGNLTSVKANWQIPLDLSSSSGVFNNLNKTNCTLNVPYGTKALYASANQWKDFTNIVESANGFSLGAATASVGAAANSSTTVALNANVSWSASSDQSWLSVSPASGTSNSTLTLKATTANTSIGTRSATVTVSSSGYSSQTVLVSQEGGALTLTAGTLSTTLTATQLATLTYLKLTGAIDARDFRTMRDLMPLLAEVDLSGTSIVAYTGTEGTSIWNNTNYTANSIPEFAFMNSNWQGKTSLTAVKLPTSALSISQYAFRNCDQLNFVEIPNSIQEIGSGAFGWCSNLTSISIPASASSVSEDSFTASSAMITVDVNNTNYSSLDGVLYNKTKTILIHCPMSKTGSFTVPSSVLTIEDSSFYYCNGLTSIQLPSSLTSIGHDAFFSCDQLTSLTIPSSVNTIRPLAFADCNKLTSLVVEANNPNYSSADGILFSKTKTELVACLSAKTGNYTIPSSVSAIIESAFWDCSGLTTITIPTSVKTIGNASFTGCRGLTSLDLPSSISSIGRNAFQDCGNLASIKTNWRVPLNLASSNVFEGLNQTSCTLNVPYGTKTLYASANQWKDFTNIVESATGFSLGAATASIGSAANSTATVALNANVNWSASSDQSWLSITPASGTSNSTLTIKATSANPSIGTRSAKVTVSSSGYSSQTVLVSQEGGALTLTAGTLSTTLTAAQLSTLTYLKLTGTIDARDFRTMRDLMPMLAEVDLSGATIVAYTGTEGTSIWGNTNYSVNTVPEFAFCMNYDTGKTTLTRINLPSNVTTISTYSFLKCTNLSTIVLPSSLQAIGSGAFTACWGLTSILLPPSLTLIGSNSFESSSLESIFVPASVSIIEPGAFMHCNKLPAIDVETSSPYFKSVDGVLFNKSLTDLVEYPAGKLNTTYTIPETVTSINSNAFWDCQKIISLVIPGSVKSIKSGAFTGCAGLTSIELPLSIVSIENGGFQYCGNLTSIKANWQVPLDLSSSSGVFNNLNKTNCTLNVPYGTKALYASANQWKDFTNIVESANGFSLGAATASVGSAANSTTTVVLKANVSWSASSDQSWLSVSPASGTSNSTLTIKATTANTSIGTRSATVTVSSSGYNSQTVLVSQDGNNGPLNITAGTLSTTLTASELASIVKLTLTGTIDARDFRTMRDLMPLLAEVDLSGASIVAYTGTEGTIYENNNTYQANQIPYYAFRDPNTYPGGKTSLTAIKLPTTTTVINNDAFGNCTNLSLVSIPSSVLTLGSNAFYNCDGLTSITVPVSLTSIGFWTFGDCDKLTSFTIPGTVTSIGNNAFTYCDLLTSLVVDNANTNYSFADGVLFNKAKTELVACLTTKSGSYSIPATVLTIKFQAFWGCGGLTTILIPTSVKTIENRVFTGCQGLTTLDLPSSITAIGSYAFQDCGNLTSVKANWQIPLDLSSSSGVFNNLNKTNCTLNVPYGTKALYASANQWKDFTNIVESANGFSLGAATASVGAAANSSTTVALNANVSWSASSDQSWLSVSPASGTSNSTLTLKATTANTSIGTRSVTVTVSSSGYSSQTVLVTQEGGALTLTAGTLSTTLTATQLATTTYLRLTGTIDARDFRTMRDLMPLLAEVDLSGASIVAYTGIEGSYYGSNRTYLADIIPSYAFRNPNTYPGGKASLTSVKLPTTAIGINNSAFENCTNLISVTIPSSVLSIGNYAFRNCRELAPIQLPGSLTSIGYGAFSNCDKLTLLAIPASLKTISPYAFSDCDQLTSLNIDASNTNYLFIDGILFNKVKTELVACLMTKTGNYTIPATVVSITEGAFWDCQNLTAITIPISVKTIGWGAFTGCYGLTSFDIPSSVTAIGSSVFQNCSNLTSLKANWPIPLNLTGSQSQEVFWGVDKTNCTLYVPYGAKSLYASANQWKDFTNIVEAANGFNIGVATLSVSSAANSTKTIALKANVRWTASFNSTWLSVSPDTGSSSSTLTFTALSANTFIASRSAIVTFSATGYENQKITVTQEGVDVPVNLTAGTLSTTFTSDELANIRKLTLTGTIDARDFKTMRDLMPMLAEINLSGATIVAYTGTEGTNTGYSYNYSANDIPIYAFYNNSNGLGKTSLTSIKLPVNVVDISDVAFGNCINLTTIILPVTLKFIGADAFYFCTSLTSLTLPDGFTTLASWAFESCSGLTTVSLPKTLTSIGDYAFYDCTGLTTLNVYNPSPVDLSAKQDVFYNIDKSHCTLNVPAGSKSLYASAVQWKDFYLNQIPVANAGIDQTVNEGELTGLRGNTSSDADNNILSYSWTAPEGIILNNGSTATATFTAPNVLADTSYTFTLTVSDGKSTSTDQVIVTVKNKDVALHFIPVWTGQGVDHMNINVYSARLDGQDLQAGDEIGIFDGTKCVGVGQLQQSISQTQTLNIVVSLDDGTGNGYVSGNAITYKFYDKSNAQEILNVTASYSSADVNWITDGRYVINGTSFVSLSGATTATQTISFSAGWNIVSANVKPSNTDMKALFQSLIDAGKLKKVMDESGKTLENFGMFGGWKNNIGNWQPTEGYKVNVTAATKLVLEGTPLMLPYDIPLTTGWNIVSYPAVSSQDVKAAFQSLIDSGKLKKVMDESGKTLENFGMFGGWKNNIGSLAAGKGYKVNVTVNCTLTITEGGTKGATIVPEVLASTHFAPVYSGNGIDHMNIHLVNLQASGIKVGDEIGIYDGSLCVGSATIGAEQLMDGSISIPASSNDGLGQTMNGFTCGNPVNLQLFRAGQTYQLNIEKFSGTNSFDKNQSLFAQVNIDELDGILNSNNSDQFKCFPNPFDQEINIEVQYAKSTEVTIEIYNITGQRIKTLFKGTNNGNLLVKWNGTSESGQKVAPGVYLCKVNGQSKQLVFK
jgi:ABC-type tungstate transport system substrate-binding protein